MDENANGRLNALTVLLVEDDQDHELLFRRKFFGAALTGLLTCVRNGLLAVRHIMEQGIPDIVITDLSMPVMTGYELISWIRSDSAFQGLPIVIHSSSDSRQDKERAFMLGATEYLLKNSSCDQLKGLIDRLQLNLKAGRSMPLSAASLLVAQGKSICSNGIPISMQM